ncbi:hypothetical protein ACWC24_18920 [Streptomyces sp. NPDC001443]
MTQAGDFTAALTLGTATPYSVPRVPVSLSDAGSAPNRTTASPSA